MKKWVAFFITFAFVSTSILRQVDATQNINIPGGATGATGAGSTGTSGRTGATGASGAGFTGATGASGTNGSPGSNGSTGFTGATGASGTNGSNGAIGSTGATGKTGLTGASGTNGTNGNTGLTGASGTNGTLGSTGATGASGAGSVTSVTFTGDGTVLSSTPSSAVTTSGTLTAALASQSGNVFIASPSNGTSGALSARAIVAADLGSSTFPGNNYSNAYYVGSTANTWNTSSATYADFTVNGTIPSPTSQQNNGFSGLAKAASNLPGIAITTPARAGVIEITAVVMLQMSAITVASLKLIETVTSTTIDIKSAGCAVSGGNYMAVPLQGYFSASASTAYNFKIQGKTSAGAITFGDTTAAPDAMVTFNLKYVN